MNFKTQRRQSVSTLGTGLSPRSLLWGNLILLALLAFIFLAVSLFQLFYEEWLLLLFVGMFSALLLAWMYPIETALGLLFGRKHSQRWVRWMVRAIPSHYRALLAYVIVWSGVWLLIVQGGPVVLADLKQLSSNLPQAATVLQQAFAPLKGLGFRMDVAHWLLTFKSQVYGQLTVLSQASIKPFIYLLLGQIITFYILLDGLRLRQFATSILPRSLGRLPVHVVRLYPVVMVRTLRAYSIISLFSASVFAGLALCLQVPHAFVLVLWTLVTAFIPVLGPWLSLLLPLLTFIAYGRLDACLWLVFSVILASWIRSRWIGPRLFKRGYRFHPLTLLILMEVALYLGQGWQGLLLFIPLVVFVSCLKRLGVLFNAESAAV